jgi:ribosomal protein S18 acetylase RimI-like enzyme
MQNLRIIPEPHPSRDDIKAVSDAVEQFNLSITRDDSYSPIAVFLRDDNEVLQGGVVGDAWGGWLHILFIWVSDAVRYQGYGSKLLLTAERLARERGCKGVYLETFSFQAKPFYEGLGYKVFGELEDYPGGYKCYFMKKGLDGIALQDEV